MEGVWEDSWHHSQSWLYNYLFNIRPTTHISSTTQPAHSYIYVQREHMHVNPRTEGTTIVKRSYTQTITTTYQTKHFIN